MITRRRVLALLLAATTGLSGCSADSPTDATETTEQNEPQTSTDRGVETTPSDQSTKVSSTQTTSDGLNDTDYTAAWPFAPDGVVGQSYESPLTDAKTAAALLTSSTEARQFLAAVESTTGISSLEIQLITATNFSTSSVVVVQRSVSSGSSRLRLQSVEAVETTHPRLAVSEVNPGATQAAPTRLLLVRVPDEGTPPEAATVRVAGGGGTTTTVTADPYN